MNMKRVVLPLLAAAAVLAAFGHGAFAAAPGAPASSDESSPPAHKSPRKKLGPSRGLAALPSRSVARMGQGESMLYNVTDTSPAFLRTQEKGRVPVRIAGVCSDANGVTYSSAEKGYSSCLDAQGSATSEYDHYGSAQRQAGVGILVGK